MTTYRILAGDCIARMKMMDRSSVDNIITDPPYEIGFMGKGWDNTGVAYNPATWRAAHRVLKQNGLMLVFGATRTHHRIAHAIQRAGFEIVDIIAWCYGTGFPKSHNISKAIDKRGGKDVSWFGKWLKQWREENGIAQKEVAELFPSKTGNLTGCVANWELGFNPPTNEQFNLICKTFDLPFSNMEEAKGEYLGKIKHSRSGGDDFAKQVGSKSQSREEEVFATATEPAKQWEGWGTALKPAWEPIIVARKKNAKFSLSDYTPFHYIPKSSKSERSEGLESVKNNHPTVKPIALMEALVKEFTEEGSTVFDPFTGSGTTGIASVKEGRNFIGCELTPEYIPLARARIEYHLPKEED
jgi:DNA modification methylase